MRSRARVGRVFPRNFEFSQTFTSVSLGRVSGIHGQPIRRNMTTVLENETMQMKTKLDFSSFCNMHQLPSGKKMFFISFIK